MVQIHLVGTIKDEFDFTLIRGIIKKFIYGL